MDSTEPMPGVSAEEHAKPWPGFFAKLATSPALVAMIIIIVVRLYTFFIADKGRPSQVKGEGRVLKVRSKTEWENIKKSAGEEGKYIIVDFMAKWCGPCKRIAPDFAILSIATSFRNTVFLKVDVDEVPEIAEECKVRSMPTFILFSPQGKVLDMVLGADKMNLAAMLSKHCTTRSTVFVEEESDEKEGEEEKKEQ